MDRRIDLMPAADLIPTPMWLRWRAPSPHPHCPSCAGWSEWMGRLQGSDEWSCSQCGARWWTPRH